MRRVVVVPVKKVGKEEWCDLSALGLSHEFVGETIKLKNQNFSFAGGHRVRLYLAKKNVHWRMTSDDFDITELKTDEAAPRKKMRA